MNCFDGKKIRDNILAEVAAKIKSMPKPPTICVISIGDDEVCNKYVGLKKKTAESVGAKFQLLCLSSHLSQEEVITRIDDLNSDPEIDGIMIQIPVPEHLDKFSLVEAIDQKKDVDGLRFCGGFRSCFNPPVVLAILEAIKCSGKDLKDAEVVIVGRGFLVGWPLYQCLEEAVPGLIVTDAKTKNLEHITKEADVLISATGQANLIKPDMIKEGVVLIDAGTSELGGELLGDIDQACYKKASFYTPSPGGIGPVTIAMLLKNLVETK